MWGYYGSKSNIVDSYPAPSYGEICEPFAGTAQYALRWFDRDVTIVDKYEVIVRLWKWLQQCSEGDVLGLPRLKVGESVDSFTWDCEEAKWLVGFIITGAPTMPKKTASRWKTVIRPNTQDHKLGEIARNLRKIRHWKVVHGSYADIPNAKKTWFVDPPYQFGGEHYRHGNRDIDFAALARWCGSLEGQVIVCENTRADWLPFSPLVKIHGSAKDSTEAVWIRETEKVDVASRISQFWGFR